MIHQHIEQMVQYLHLHPHWGGIVTFLLAFTESLAVIGTFIPGSVTMTAIGILIGTGVLPAGATLFAAVAGAYAGDCISYWVGIHYKQRLRRMWPFNRYPKLIEKGEEFFKIHGGKSIIIGRFTGPVRSLIPVIAGLLEMRPMRFLPICLAAAILWAVIYTVPGIIIGALSTELPPSIATKFILVCLLLIAILWALTWLIKFFFDQMWNQIDRSLIKLWNYLNVHKSSHWITQLLRNPKHDEDHQQLVRAVFTIVFLVLFLWIVMIVLQQGTTALFNVPLFNLLQSAHTNVMNNFAIIMMMLGGHHVLGIMAVTVLIWLCWRRNWWAVLHWGLIILLSLLAIEIFRHAAPISRPPIRLTYRTPSFPADHTLLSLTFLGFLAVLIGDNIDKTKRAPIYITAITLVGIVSLSTLYLGSQWFTDILGSLFLGMFIILVVILSYRRRNLKPIPPLTLLFIFFISTAIIWIGYSYFNFQFLQQSFTKSWPIQEISENNWWRQTPGQLPSYRMNRIGHPTQPLNIQWYGSLDKITQELLQQGWQNQPPNLDLTTTINRLGLTKQQTKLPVIPPLYHDRSPKLLLIKPQGQDQTIIMLRLWESDIVVDEGNTPLWIGSISYYQPPPKLLSLPKNVPTEEDAINALVPDIKEKFRIKEMKLKPKQQPPEIKHLYWDGRLLLIRDK